MPQTTTPIVRTSLTEPLLARYNAVKDLADVGGGSAKDVGTAKADVVTPSDQTIQAGFTEFQKLQVTEFTSNALNYAATLGLKTTPYAPSGRLPD